MSSWIELIQVESSKFELSGVMSNVELGEINSKNSSYVKSTRKKSSYVKSTRMKSSYTELTRKKSSYAELTRKKSIYVR